MKVFRVIWLGILTAAFIATLVLGIVVSILVLSKTPGPSIWIRLTVGVIFSTLVALAAMGIKKFWGKVDKQMDEILKQLEQLEKESEEET